MYIHTSYIVLVYVVREPPAPEPCRTDLKLFRWRKLWWMKISHDPITK